MIINKYRLIVSVFPFLGFDLNIKRTFSLIYYFNDICLIGIGVYEIIEKSNFCPPAWRARKIRRA